MSGLKRFRKLPSQSENLLIGSKHVTREEGEVGIYFRMSSIDLDGYLCLR